MNGHQVSSLAGWRLFWNLDEFKLPLKLAVDQKNLLSSALEELDLLAQATRLNSYERLIHLND